MFPQGDLHVISSAPEIAPSRLTADWIYSRRNDPKPTPIAFHHGVVDASTLLPVADADAVVVCGFLGCDLRPFNPLIAALPRVLHLKAAEAEGWVAHVIEQAVLESHSRRPGGDAMLERLSEMLFVNAARSYLNGLPEDATGWVAGLRDRFVGKALKLIHERPDHAWTVEDLSQQVGLSRSALHDRFTRFLGEPPIQYLANWRLELGSRLLRETNRNVAAIALEVGYESDAAFSRAFRRLVGKPPAAWRKLHGNV